jgi:hypothetical protein
MHSAELVLHVYEEIAEHYQQSGNAEQRDIFLVLAADAAFAAGHAELAEQLRLRLLTLNPYHILRPYASFAEALQSSDIQLYIEDLLRRHPPEQAPQLLEDLKARRNATASRDLLFAEFAPQVDNGDLRVFQQYDESLTPPAPAKKPAPPAETPRRAPAPVPTLPVNMTPAVPWLRSDPPTYQTGPETPEDAGGDAPDLLDTLAAYALFGLVGLLAAALLGYTLVVPLLK